VETPDKAESAVAPAEGERRRNRERRAPTLAPVSAREWSPTHAGTENQSRAVMMTARRR
jgi:hypothetical protein